MTFFGAFRSRFARAPGLGTGGPVRFLRPATAVSCQFATPANRQERALDGLMATGGQSAGSRAPNVVGEIAIERVSELS